MADNTELKNMLRLGKVMSVDKDKMTARVKFADKGGIQSSPLHILKHTRYIIPTMESENEGQTAQTELEYDVDNVKKKIKHKHEAYLTEWVPDVNSTVVCLMTPDGDGDGFIIGEV